jgi:putative membrane protein
MKRNFVDYFILVFKGMAMGAADVVPGVSGGTIAFISGVYEELIATLNSINLNSLKTLKLQGLSATWKKINGNFLLALFGGILLSILSLSKLVAWLLHEEPVLLWAFFSVLCLQV